MSQRIESSKSVVLLGGVLCYALALGVTILAPEFLTDQSQPKVVGVDGVAREVKPYTALEAKGRSVYGAQVCWHCHSQFTRPVNDEDRRYGPVSQTGEYAFDVPHFFGTRRTGPDLHREGGLRTDDWHYAHLWDPRSTVPLSVMPSFTWLFQSARQSEGVAHALKWLDTNGDGVVSTKIGDEGGAPPASVREEVERARLAVASQDEFTRLDVRGVSGPGAQRDGWWWHEEQEGGDGLVSDYDGGPRPTAEAIATVAYLQRMGTNIGKWRRPLHAPTPSRVSPFDAVPPRPRPPEEMRVHGFLAHDEARVQKAEEARRRFQEQAAAWDKENPLLAHRLAKGREVYQRHCTGCHGAEGRGNGPAAQFLLVRPRDFTTGKYKYRSTPVGSMPLDGDLYRSLFRGLPGSSMPAWRELSDEQLWLLVDFVKSFYEGSKSWNDLASVVPVSPPQRFDPNPSKEVARGRAVYLAAQCYNCHGLEGRGDGPGWNDTATDWGNALRPRDLRPRITPADAGDLHGLLLKRLERWAGPEAWKTLSQAQGLKDLEPSDAARAEKFALFVLGQGPRLLDALGGAEAVKAAVGEDAFKRDFSQGDDALEDLRMEVATEKDQPALRFRGGAHADDLYRTLMTGLEGTQMKQTFDFFWKKTEAELEGRDDLKSPRTRRFVWVPVVGAEKKLSVVTSDPALRAVGVFVKKNEKGEDEEFLKVQPGDDWALVRYVQWLACTPRQREGS